MCDLETSLSFHGKGINTPDNCGGDYSICFSKVNNLKNLPITVNEEVILYVTEYVTYKTSKQKLGILKPTLFQIVYGIIWELSFNGSPGKRDSAKANLDNIVGDLKNRYPESFS